MANCENRKTSGPNPNVERQVASLSNRLISLREAAPGSEHHAVALRELMQVLATKPGAVDALAKQQGRSSKER